MHLVYPLLYWQILLETTQEQIPLISLKREACKEAY